MEQLESLRKIIDDIDHSLLDLMAQRMSVVSQIGEVKSTHNLPSLDTTRWQRLIAERKEYATKLKLSPQVTEQIWDQLHQQSLHIQNKINETG